MHPLIRTNKGTICVIVEKKKRKKEKGKKKKRKKKRTIIMLFVSICCVTCGYPVAPQNVLCNARNVTLEMPPYHGKGEDHPVARLACE